MADLELIENLVSHRLLGDGSLCHNKSWATGHAEAAFGQSNGKCQIVRDFCSQLKDAGLDGSFKDRPAKVYHRSGFSASGGVRSRNHGPETVYRSRVGSDRNNPIRLLLDRMHTDWGYKNGEKCLPANLDFIDAECMAAWISDDAKGNSSGGTYAGGVKLCTDSFTDEDINRLIAHINKVFEISAYPVFENNRGKPCTRIVIGTRDYHDRVVPRITPFMHPAAAYKLGPAKVIQFQSKPKQQHLAVAA
jgi:LAGLIDADG DNA endonuclease family